MPYFFSLDGPDIPDDWEELIENWEDYNYMTPSEYTGSKNPVSIDVTQPSETPQTPTTPRIGSLSWFTAMLGKPEKKANQKNAHLLYFLTDALRAIGGTHAVFAYDGGNDEGFAWFRELRTVNSPIDRTSVIQSLLESDLLSELQKHELLGKSTVKQPHEQQLTTILDWWVATDLCVALLGESYGVGELMLYGACIFDLVDFTLTDDAQAQHPTDKPEDC